MFLYTFSTELIINLWRKEVREDVIEKKNAGRCGQHTPAAVNDADDPWICNVPAPWQRQISEGWTATETTKISYTAVLCYPRSLPAKNGFICIDLQSVIYTHPLKVHDLYTLTYSPWFITVLFLLYFNVVYFLFMWCHTITHLKSKCTEQFEIYKDILKTEGGGERNLRMFDRLYHGMFTFLGKTKISVLFWCQHWCAPLPLIHFNSFLIAFHFKYPIQDEYTYWNK